LTSDPKLGNRAWQIAPLCRVITPFPMRSVLIR
jgi:hypothetical protein